MIKLGHTNIRVSNLDRSIKFYEDAFGLKVVNRIDRDECSIVWLCDESQLDAEMPFFLELRHDRGHDAPYELGENSTHFAFVVDSVDTLHMLHSGMDIIYQENGNGIYFVHDPDGYSVEVMPRSFVASNLRGNV